MKLEFVDDHHKGIRCRCNHYDYMVELRTLPAAYITIDGVRIFSKLYDNVPYLIRFPFTAMEYNNGDIAPYNCLKCGRIPYVVIKNKDYIP